MNEKEKHGILRISNEADRMTIVSILFKNGYSTVPVRRKKGRANEYYVRYDLPDSIDEVVAEDDC